MKHIKIVSKGWVNYTGLLGTIWFKDGMSTEPVAQNEADRLSAVAQLVEINEDGTETPAGPAYRMIAASAHRAPITRAAARQSDAERLEEERLETLRADKAPLDHIYTADELEAIADKSGIKGLREIADAWNVKERSIPKLIGETLKAQGKFLKDRQVRRSALAQKIELALEEERVAKKKAELASKDAQDAVDKEARELAGNETFARLYTDGTRNIPLVLFIERAWAASGMTLTGFNKLNPARHADAIAGALLSYEQEHDVKLTPVVAESAQKPKVEPELDPEYERERWLEVRQRLVAQIANKPDEA